MVVWCPWYEIVNKIGLVELCIIYTACYSWPSSSPIEVAEQEEDGEENARNASKKAAPTPAAKPGVQEARTNPEEPDGSESDESDDSL